MTSQPKWQTSKGKLFPPKMLEKLRAECVSEEEFQARVKQIEESDAGRLGGFGELEIKYRVIMPEDKE